MTNAQHVKKACREGMLFFEGAAGAAARR